MSNDEFLKALGNNISKIRREKNKTALEICALINMEKSNYSTIENGRQNATSLTLKKIADALNVGVKEFYNF